MDAQMRRLTEQISNRSARAPTDKHERRPSEEDEIPVTHASSPSTVARYLGAGVVDPFLRTPVALNHTGKELVATIFTCDNGQRPHRQDWFSVGLGDQATFYIVLANSALHLQASRHPGLKREENQLARVYHRLTVTHLRRSLQDFLATRQKRIGHANRNSEDEEVDRQQEDRLLRLIGNVAGLICWADNLASVQQFRMHTQGLAELIRMHRGGLAGLPSHLRRVVSWVELRGCYMHDVVPETPLPDDWVDAAARDRSSAMANAMLFREGILRVSEVRLGWQRVFAELAARTEWLEVLEEMVLLVPLADKDFADSPVGSGLELMRELPLWTDVVIYRLLQLQVATTRAKHTIHRAVSDDGQALNTDGTADSSLSEACRLGMLLFMARVWRAYGVGPVPTDALRHKLHALVQSNSAIWITATREPALGRLVLWIVCVFCLEAATIERATGDGTMLDIGARSLQQLAALIRVPMTGQRDVERAMKRVVWVREAFDDAMLSLEAKLQDNGVLGR